jgi:hypothetical protein
VFLALFALFVFAYLAFDLLAFAYLFGKMGGFGLFGMSF